MKPTRNNVLVERIPGAKLTDTGIILKSTLDPDRGKVEAIGPEVEEVSIGEEVFLNWNAATKIDKSIGVGYERYIVPVTEIVFVFE